MLIDLLMPIGSISRIDTKFLRSEFCGVFLLNHGAKYSIVEAGSTLSVPPTLEFMKANNIDIVNIENIFITHAHLDHMGGVGMLAAAIPEARIYCHPASLPHIVDPLSKLAAAAI